MDSIDPTTLVVSTPLAARLRQHVEYFASPALKGRKPGTPGIQQAARYLEKAFEGAGLEPLPSLGSYCQTIAPSIGDNLIGIRPAHSVLTENRWLLLGAHYDHLGECGGKIYAGADDNAAALAIMIETAFAATSLINYSLLFVAFNAEEPPFIRTPQMGSQYFVDHLPPEIGNPSSFQAAIIMDLMGGAHWEPLQDTIFVAGTEMSPELHNHVKHTLAEASSPSVLPIGLHLIEAIPIIGRTPFSDYDAFRNASVPFVFLSAGRTPRYHQPTDLPETLHYERMASTCQWIHTLLQHIDQDPHPFQFRLNGLEFQDDVKALGPLIAKAASWETKIPGTSHASLLKMKMDAQWVRHVSLDHPQEKDIRRLERASLRMQCLLADFPGAFLL